ncbi:hypothetical protein [Pyxidicoccus xibeiensis]|uniref:hypothetical protein n=1 Tax=Pyxidicoccus xibeiensis TaxID=2906759 RepID=UPI0020A76996|nr:hypothetical protein [Pyxidicoccus xibeiensis]MCP3140714.1 hypothetical protein [Pyxidicoccus xibeiensis]
MRKHLMAMAAMCLGALCVAQAQDVDEQASQSTWDDGSSVSYEWQQPVPGDLTPQQDSAWQQSLAGDEYALEQPLAGSYQLEQPLAGSYQLEQPLVGSYQLQQPIAGSYQLQQPMAGSYQLRQPMAGSYQLRQPMAGSYQLRRPIGSR